MRTVWNAKENFKISHIYNNSRKPKHIRDDSPHRHFPSFNQEDGLFELNIYRILNRFGIYKEVTCYLSDGFTNCSSNSKFLSPQTIE